MFYLFVLVHPCREMFQKWWGHVPPANYAYDDETRGEIDKELSDTAHVALTTDGCSRPPGPLKVSSR